MLVEATGHATHLGLFTLDIPHVVNRANRTAIGTYEFTAANGDKVFADFTGLATPTATPGVLYIEEIGTITGGTGRFAGATGTFTSERWFDTINLTTTGDFEGTISSPGAASTLLAPASATPFGLSPDQISGQQPDSSASFGSDNAQKDHAVVTLVLE